MSMSTYIPSVIDEKLYEQTKRDAVASYAPPKKILVAGGLAGVIATWLPALIIYPIVFFYKYKIGGKMFMTGSEKLQAALDWLGGSLGSYSRIAIWLTLALGAYGVFMAYLRRKSAVEDRYLKLQLARHGTIRMGLDSQLTTFSFPIIITIGLFIAQQLHILIIALVIIVLAGAVYYGVWQKLHDFILRLMHRQPFEETTALALRLMIPRTVGWRNARVTNLEVNKAEKNARITGEFANKDVEMDVRNIVEHYLRGYHPVYVINNITQK